VPLEAPPASGDTRVGFAGVPGNGGRAKAARCDRVLEISASLAAQSASAPLRPAEIVLLSGLSAGPAIATARRNLGGAIALQLLFGFSLPLALCMGRPDPRLNDRKHVTPQTR